MSYPRESLLPPPPTGRRVYAHVEKLSLTCPKCGQIVTGKLPHPEGKGYDAKTSTFRCPRAKCGYRAYVGVIFWPLRTGRSALPPDHVLTPGEAAALRLELSYVESRSNQAPRPASQGGGVGQTRTQATNRVCTCTESCPVHPEGPKAAQGAPR